MPSVPLCLLTMLTIMTMVNMINMLAIMTIVHGASVHAKGVCLYVPHLLVRWHSVKLTFAKTKFLVASSSQQRALLDVYPLP